MSPAADPIEKARTLRLALHPRGSLFCGGYSAALGASGGETASDRQGLLIPASAVKGALRETALRLVRAANQDFRSFVALFGDEFQEDEGKLCFGVLRPPDEVGHALSTRHHVSLSRATRSAVAGHLFDQRVVAAGLDLVFTGSIELREPLEEGEWHLLRLAAEMTDRLGAGRGQGLGQVEIHLEPCAEPVSRVGLEGSLPGGLAQGGSDRLHDVVFEIEAVEPMKLGRVKDRSNVESTDEVMRGSMFRGAVAGGLLRQLRATVSRETGSGDAPPITESHEVMDLVFAEPGAVIFGDGHPVLAASEAALDLVPAPLTLQESKDGRSLVDDALSLARIHLASSAPTVSRAGLRSAKGSWGRQDGVWRRVKVPRRLLTRLARDPASGRAADGRLYSLDVIDPGDPDLENGRSGALRYQLPVRGSAEQLDWVRRSFEGGIRVGGTRSRGLGRVELKRVLADPRSSLAERHRAWVRALESASVKREAAAATGILLALGPVVVPQPRLLEVLEQHGLRLLDGRSKRRLMGGWNSKAKLPRRTGSAFVAGSTWIVEKVDGSSALPALEALEESGLGPGRADGWGRLVACHAIHLEVSGSLKGERSE